jgi:uncharacterized Zn finger protein
MTLAEVLTSSHIRHWAGPRTYVRGEAYFEEGYVSNLKAYKGRITAVVTGTHKYRVRLWEDDDTVDYECDCPMGLQGDFCKHCVATALAWLDDQAPFSNKNSIGKRKQSEKVSAGLTMEDARAWLMRQKKEALAEMLIEAAAEDEQLGNRLMLKAAAAKGVNLATYHKVIDQAIGGGGFIDYHHMYDYYRGVGQAIDAIEELLEQGQAVAVVELSEYALQRIESAIEHVDDSDGYMSMLLYRLQEMHLAACRKARPDAEALAERLFAWELTGEWDTFSNVVSAYAPVFGKKGMQRYRALAESKWAKVKPLKPGEDDRNKYGRRYRITSIMENLAEHAGDTEALVAIKQRDLSSSYHYLQIAEIYRKARRSDQALEWAEKGIQTFGDEADTRLQDFLADLYHRRKRHDEAMALIWPQFERHPALGNYQKLKKHADRCKRWAEWRERALKYLRAVIEKESSSHPRSRWSYGTRTDRSRLVEIFLWEKDAETAWQEACEGGCSSELWLKLAALREKDHPRDAIAVYQKLISPIVDRTNNDAYAEAAGLLRRVEKLMNALGERDEFRQHLSRVRVEYKRKRNFMKLLERFG